MFNNQSDFPDCKPVFVTRVPMFDRDDNVLGYELLLDDDRTLFKDQLCLVKAVATAMEGLEDERLALFSLPADRIIDDTVFSLPRDRFVLQVGDWVHPDKDVVNASERLKFIGYGLAVDGYRGQSDLEPFVDMCDYLKIPVKGMSPKKLLTILGQAKKYNCELVACDVDDWETFEGTKSLGFNYFQGQYFHKPRIVSGKKLSVGSVAKLELLSELVREDCEFKDLEPLISKDPALSYRLLKFINSASFSLIQKVKSIGQAMSLLGMSSLKQWTMVVIMTGVDHTGKGEELAYLVLKRARFLECSAVARKDSPYPPETMFLLGLFSKLDAMLGTSMDSILEKLPLEDGLKEILCGSSEHGGQWLRILEAVESGQWGRVSEMRRDLNMPPQNAAVRYLRASAWAGQSLKLIRPDMRASCQD